MHLQPVIGLETHIQLNTKTKMFCGCNAHDEGSAPNTHVCPICVGHPGTLPVPNARALESAIHLGLALNGTITEHSKFDRKNYFYPDLAKAYQISQFDLPIMRDGSLTIDVVESVERIERSLRLSELSDGSSDAQLAQGVTADRSSEAIAREARSITIGIERMHLEEDSAKNIHGTDGKTYVDFNRSSVPLCEIVTRPDFRTSAQAKAYVQELRLLVRTLDISEGDLERGHMRCDVNISLREVDENGFPIGPLNTKTEIKNINSFRAIERAIEYEIVRQTALWNAGTPPSVITTRGWNDATQSTEEQRVKEDAADYRYFPEPDIPPLDLSGMIADLKLALPELPRAKRARFETEYGLKPDAARQIIDDIALANYTEELMSELSENKVENPAKLVTSWLLTKFNSILTEQKKIIETATVTPAHFAEFLTLIANGSLTAQKGLDVLALMETKNMKLSEATESLGATSLTDTNAIDGIVREVLEANAAEVARYKAGETKLFPFLLGQVMRAAKGNANPAQATDALTSALSAS